MLAAAGARLGELRDAGAGAVGNARTHTSPPASAAPTPRRYREAELLELADAGHWPWLDRPDMIDRVAGFLARAGADRGERGVFFARRAQRRAAKRSWGSRVCPPGRSRRVCGLVYVLAAPPSADLAAAGYRSELFARAGFTIWDNGWYGGHHLPAYSLLAPAFGALARRHSWWRRYR